jgi:diguanylate cyclase (GGDEF)-like protein/PAS domain S-box-containing protein
MKKTIKGVAGNSPDLQNNDSIQSETNKSNKAILPISDSYLLNHLLDFVPEFIYFKDLQSRFIKISASLSKSFGLDSPSQMIGKTDYDFFSDEHAMQAFEGEQEIIRTGRSLSIEEKETRPGLPDRWVLTTKMPIYDEQGIIIGTFGISRDITDRKSAEDNLRLQANRLQNQIEEINLLQEQLTDQATHDTLTGLYNRRKMDQVLNQQLSDCQKLKQTFCIVILDIDQFKRINDEYGHQIGDVILKEYGKCILDSTRADDFSCRLGGDEILMAFQKMTIAGALKKADDIRKKLGAISIQREGQQISTTVSIGIASYPENGNSINELIAQADGALYSAKEKGRNQVVLAS